MIPLSLAMAVASAGVSTDARGPTLYAFFATWCVPCRAELPVIEALHREYRDRGLRVQLVSEDAPATAAEVPGFLARFGVTAEWQLDADSELLIRYHPAASVPFTVLVGASGEILYAHAGYQPGDEVALEAAIVDALAADTTLEKQPTARVSSSTQMLGVWRRSRFDPVRDGELRAGVLRQEVSARLGPAGEAGCSSEVGCVEVSARIDGALMDDEVSGEERDLRPERVAVELQRRGARVRLGDTTAAFGHGVSLSLRRIDTLGVDTALRGGRARINAGPVTLTVLGGVINPQNLDPILFRETEDPGDRLGGAELTLELVDEVTVSPYFLLADAPGAASDGGDRTWAIGGISTTQTWDDLRLLAEVATAERTGFARDDAETGWAAYLSLGFTRPRWSVLLEGKSYRRWLLGREEETLLYHEPPTLERDDQEVPANDDAVGARLRGEWRALETLTLFANFLGYRYSEDGSDPIDGSTALHGYAGATFRPDRDLTSEVSAGYRDETFPDGRDKLQFWHIDADVQWRLAERWALVAEWQHKSETKILFSGPRDFVRGLAVVSIARPGLGSIAGLYGYSTEVATRPTHYPGGELRVELPQGGEARLFVGRLSGGRVCVSGSCRDLPPFEGARLDLVVRL